MAADARSTVTYEVLGEISVKGKAEPIATFQVVEETEADEEATTPFVGRETELAAIAEVYDRVVQGRRAALVTVVGAPGVGKTRLAAVRPQLERVSTQPCSTSAANGQARQPLRPSPS